MGTGVRLCVGVFCFLRSLMVVSMWFKANTPKTAYSNAFNNPRLFCCISDTPPCRQRSTCSIRAEERFVTEADVAGSAPWRVDWIAYGFANAACGLLIIFNKHPVLGALTGLVLTLWIQPIYPQPDTLQGVDILQC